MNIDSLVEKIEGTNYEIKKIDINHGTENDDID